MTLRFEELPPRAIPCGWTDNDAVAAELKDKRGQWATVKVYAKIQTASTAAYRINQGHIGAYRPAGTFEAYARTIRGGDVRLYARFVGVGSGA